MKERTVLRNNKDKRNRAIGVFDSGIGGLTVLREIKGILPREDIIYFGDTARVPYGTKSKATVTKFAIQVADFLVDLKVKVIVVACNTASSFGLHALKRRYNIPVIGVIKAGARRAVSATKNMRIGVIGTKATVSSGVYEKAIKRLNSGVNIISVSCPLFVPLVEENWLKGDVTRKAAERYLNPFKKKNIDTLILGCTHYPLLRPIIRETLGNDVRLIDSAKATAEEVKKVLHDKEIYKKKTNKAEYSFYVSDEPKPFKNIGGKFLGSSINSVKKVEIDA
ncbi:MAG: glutamate racemase [Candidatus Omnitrophota bacterium]|nr:glutamate racemase [Candidatus Omnitrophota bacterium]